MATFGGNKVERLRTRIARLIRLWSPRLGVTVRSWHLRKMKTYWASVNERDGKIWFDEGLADAPAEFVEVVVVHELAHLRTDGHDGNFHALMDRHVPHWRRLQQEYAAPMTQHS